MFECNQIEEIINLDAVIAGESQYLRVKVDLGDSNYATKYYTIMDGGMPVETTYANYRDAGRRLRPYLPQTFPSED